MKIQTKFELSQDVWCLFGHANARLEKGEVVGVLCLASKDEGENYIKYRVAIPGGYVLRIPEYQVFKTKKEAEDKQSITKSRLGGVR